MESKDTKNKAKITLDINIACDDASQIKRLVLHLRKKGYDCSILTTGAEILAYPWDAKKDILLLNHRLKDADGIDVLSSLSGGKESPMAILMMVECGDLVTALKSLQQGVYDFMVKPVDLVDLDYVLDDLLRLSDAEASCPSEHRPVSRISGLRQMVPNCHQCPKIYSCNQIEGLGWVGIFSRQMRKVFRHASNPV